MSRGKMKSSEGESGMEEASKEVSLDSFMGQSLEIWDQIGVQRGSWSDGEATSGEDCGLQNHMEQGEEPLFSTPLAVVPPREKSGEQMILTTVGSRESEVCSKQEVSGSVRLGHKKDKECTVPSKLLLQLTTAFQKGGLCDRDGTFFYKDHLHKSSVPILALAGDQDLICPPEAVYVKLIPENLVTYKVFGEPGGPHYAHYDLVGGCLAAEQVYPCITEFLSRHDMT
ncbi:hypothetical protein F0562_025255 [Nyssa sinensis]|uniref:AB hydrolase-1 domain-containing protein n=1 Tax=Nyssa sinensis TaxID=561372 RepID=A0A5J5BHR8_9ASTE|nr:hypothetical protein F0562_025255 [Nyssa sinensis]